MATYPSSLVTVTQLPVRADGDATPTNHVADHNNIGAEMIAVEAELGTLPKGGYADVKTRLDQGVSSERQVYEAFRALGATDVPLAWGYDPAVNDQVGATNTLTTQRLTGMAMMVPKTVTATGIMVHCRTAGTSFNNFSGCALYSMTSSGTWTFLSGTANDTTLFNAISINKKAFTVNPSPVLSPGVVYMAAIIASWTGTAPILSGFGNTDVNMNITSFFRVGGASPITTQGAANTNITPVAFTNTPWIAIY